MPTIMTHAVVAVAAGGVFNGHALPARFWVVAVAAAILPDADVLGYLYLDIPYGHALGHRGFFHSPCFAALFSLVATRVIFPEARMLSRRWWAYVLFFFAVGASHGLMDAMTNGGRGIALLSPVSNQRYFLPWTPIEVSPLGVRGFFNSRGLAVMQSEIMWVWLPAACMLVVGSLMRRFMPGRPGRKT